MQFQVTYVKITKQGINHTFETFRESGLEISLNHDKYDQISITNRQVLYEDIKVFPGSVTAWQKSATEMWFKYMTLKKVYKRFQVHFLCAQDLNDCLTALERMGIVVKHSDTRYTLKASNQSIEQEFEPVTEPPFLPSQSSKPREILAKRRVQGKAEYLIAVGESREWVVYSSEWPIADQQLALEYEKLSSSQLIENYTNLKDSSDNVSTPQISSPVLDTSAAPKGLIIGDTAGINSQGNTLHLSDQINLDKEKATETAFVDLDSVNLMQFEPSADRKKFILAHLQSNSERYLSQLSKILGSN